MQRAACAALERLGVLDQNGLASPHCNGRDTKDVDHVHAFRSAMARCFAFVRNALNQRSCQDVRVFKDFHFDAAHHLPTLFPAGHPNHRLHGHSYRVRVTLEGKPCAQTGMIEDLGAVDAALTALREALDHRYLNEDVPGLGVPTLENLAVFIWNELADRFGELAMVGVYRDSSGEGCEYSGEMNGPNRRAT